MPSSEGNAAAMKKKTRKSNNRAVSQVIAALKNSNCSEGPTMTDIIKFISSSVAHPVTKRQVITALKRGVEYGILKRNRGHYSMTNTEETVDESSGPPPRNSTSQAKLRSSDRVQKRGVKPLRRGKSKNHIGKN